MDVEGRRLRLGSRLPGVIVATLLVCFGVAPVLADSATRVYVNTVPGGGAKQRAATIAVGNGQCTPYFSQLRWKTWGAPSARAFGKVTYREPDFEAGQSCGSAPDITRNVTVILSRRTTCRGRSYYRRLKSSGTDRAFAIDCGRSQGQ